MVKLWLTGDAMFFGGFRRFLLVAGCLISRVAGRWCGGAVRRRVDGIEGVAPGAKAAGGGHFVLDALLAVEQELGEIGEESGVAGRDAIFGDEFEEASDDVIDVRNGLEFSREGGQLIAEAVKFEELALFAGMKVAERRVRGVAKHTAAAAVSIGVLAQIGFERRVSGARRSGGCVHESAPREK